MLMQKYLRSQYVGKEKVSIVEKCLRELNDYVSKFPEVIKINIYLSGSFSTGLACRNTSALDVVVCMNGGQLTDSLESDQLALALLTGLQDSTFLRKLEPVCNGTGMITCTTSDGSLSVCMRVCKPNSIPVTNLFHSRLFASYALMDPAVPAFVCLIKDWALQSGFSSPSHIPESVLSGFHWTCITLHFLVESEFLPNLHIARSPISTTLQYGPRSDRDSFVVVEDKTVPLQLLEDLNGRNVAMKHLIVNFFHWLSRTDLLDTCICMQGSGTHNIPNPTKGWIFIADPTRPGLVNTVNSFLFQRDQVIFAMKLQREALRVFQAIRSRDERVVAATLFARPGCDKVMVDKAVP